MKTTLSIGDTVTIKGRVENENVYGMVDNIFAGEWGVVRLFDGCHYHVAIAAGTHAPIFTRRELKKDKINYLTKQPQ